MLKSNKPFIPIALLICASSLCQNAFGIALSDPAANLFGRAGTRQKAPSALSSDAFGLEQSYKNRVKQIATGQTRNAEAVEMIDRDGVKNGIAVLTRRPGRGEPVLRAFAKDGNGNAIEVERVFPILFGSKLKSASIEFAGDPSKNGFRLLTTEQRVDENGVVRVNLHRHDYFSSLDPKAKGFAVDPSKDLTTVNMIVNDKNGNFLRQMFVKQDPKNKKSATLEVIDKSRFENDGAFGVSRKFDLTLPQGPWRGDIDAVILHENGSGGVIKTTGGQRVNFELTNLDRDGVPTGKWQIRFPTFGHTQDYYKQFNGRGHSYETAGIAAGSGASVDFMPAVRAQGQQDLSRHTIE